MSLPGFSAEVSLGGKSLSHYSHVQSGPGGGTQVVPALPIGGYRCVALAQACRGGSKLACQSLAYCNMGGEGGECAVTGDTVTCCYAGDCTTFW